LPVFAKIRVRLRATCFSGAAEPPGAALAVGAAALEAADEPLAGGADAGAVELPATAWRVASAPEFAVPPQAARKAAGTIAKPQRNRRREMPV